MNEQIANKLNQETIYRRTNTVIPTEAEAGAAAEWRDLRAGYHAAWSNPFLSGPSTSLRSAQDDKASLGMTVRGD